MDSLLEPEDVLFSQQALQAPWGELGRSATLGVVSLTAKVLLNVLNRFSVEGNGQERLLQWTSQREAGLGLITVSNHTSTIDDPFVFSALLPWRFFLTEHLTHHNRWSLCAKEICYKNWLLGQFFQSGKTLPIERGKGGDQPIMRTVAAEVARGHWVHVFPEGRVNFTGQLGPLRWGVGKLICDSLKATQREPVVLPFYHSGMGAVMPRGGRLPRAGHRVSVLVGEPVQLSDITCRCNREGEDQRAVWRDLTARVGGALHELERRAPPNPDQVAPGRAAHEAERQRHSEGALPEPPGEVVEAVAA